MARFLDVRQSIDRSALAGIGTAANTTLDVILQTGFGNATYLPTPSVLMTRDTNANTRANNFIPSETSTVTSGGITTLTVASTYMQQFTGTTTQIVQLPAADTLALGQAFYIANRSTSVVTVNDGSGSPLEAMTADSQAIYTAMNIGSVAGTWDVGYSVASALSNPMTTEGDIIYGGPSGTPERLPIGTTGQVLTVSAGDPAWETITTGTWNIVEFTTPGSTTWTVPAGVTNVIVTGCGGGGGGGGGAASTGNSADNAGGGGSGCPITVLPYTVTPTDVLSITIGAGGASGSGGAGSSGGGSTGTTGGAGGNTVFDALTFLGGNAGQGGASGGSGGSSAGGVASFVSGTNGGAGGSGGANAGTAGQNLPSATGGSGGTASGTGGQGGGGGGAGSFSSSAGGAGKNTAASSPGYVFTLSATTSIHCGTVFTNNAHTFTVASTTSGSATLVCNGTGAPSASGTLTYVYGDTPGNLTFNSVATNTSILTGGPAIMPAGNAYGCGGGGGGSCYQTISEALGGPGMKGGNGYIAIQWWG